MSVFAFCGICLLGCVLYLILREQAPRAAELVLVATGLFLLGGILTRLRTELAELQSMFALAKYGQMFSLLLKSMGVALLVETVADICKDAGANTLAERLLFLGKTEILLFALPLVKDLAALAEEVLA